MTTWRVSVWQCPHCGSTIDGLIRVNLVPFDCLIESNCPACDKSLFFEIRMLNQGRLWLALNLEIYGEKPDGDSEESID